MTSIRGGLDKIVPIPSKISIDRLSRNSPKREKFSDRIRSQDSKILILSVQKEYV